MDLSLTVGNTLLRFRLTAGGIAVLVLAATIAAAWDNILHDGVISGWIEVFVGQHRLCPPSGASVYPRTWWLR